MEELSQELAAISAQLEPEVESACTQLNEWLIADAVEIDREFAVIDPTPSDQWGNGFDKMPELAGEPGSVAGARERLDRASVGSLSFAPTNVTNAGGAAMPPVGSTPHAATSVATVPTAASTPAEKLTALQAGPKRSSMLPQKRGSVPAADVPKADASKSEQASKSVTDAAPSAAMAIAVAATTIPVNEEMQAMSYEQLEALWEHVKEHSNTRRTRILSLDKQLAGTEEKRVEMVFSQDLHSF